MSFWTATKPLRPDRPRADDAGARELEGLIAAVAAGDRAAFKTLYDRTAAKLLGIVLRILRDRAASEEALQDVFLRVWQNASSYAAESGRPMTWLAAIARYRAIDIARQRTEVTLPAGPDGEDPLALMPDPRGGESEIVGRDLLRRCLGRLETAQRDCVLLAYCDGYSREELAERFDRPVNTIKTWLHRGLATLRSCMDAP